MPRGGSRAGSGAKLRYKPEMCAQAEKLCKLGAITKDLGMFFDVTSDTIDRWMVTFPEFGEAIKRGRIVADAEVASKLYHRAVGYEHPDTDIRVVDKQIVKTKITKIYPPDTVAAIFWLKNRRPDLWRDRIEHTGKDGKDLPSQSVEETGRALAFLLTSAQREAEEKQPTVQ